ncbi:MAG TPA: hypothetical protein ENK52_06840 [Saprospiraceae bacterium]|nr:hypothetical protein [Saprospiraceae bacterium]
MNYFRQNLNTQGIGASAFFLVSLPQKIPIYIGLELGGITYDRANTQYATNLDGFLVQVQEETAPSIFMGHGIVRLELPTNFFAIPYIEGMFGFKNLYTRTKLKDLGVSEDNVISNSLEDGDWAFSYGATLGFSIPIGWNRMAIDLKCSYLLGTASDYFVRKTNLSTIPDQPIDYFELKNSTTDLLLPQIGITFVLEN